MKDLPEFINIKDVGLIPRSNMLIIATTLYETGYSGLDIIDYIEYSKLDDERKYRLLIIYNTIKSHIRNEQLLIFIMLVLRFIRSNIDLENILFM